MAFSESPAITVREIDATGVVPSVSSSTGALVGNFRWGPVLTPVKIDTESTLAATFGAPSSITSVDFHTAAYFLKYTNALEVVRVVDSSGVNAYAVGDAVSGLNVVINNNDNFDVQKAGLDSDGHTFLAKWPGELGSSIKVSICPQDVSDAAFLGWTYKGSFDAAPATSDAAVARNAVNDEVHVAIIDQDGKFSGTRGTVLETFPFVSLASNARNADGSTNYIKDVLNRGSAYVWAAGFDSDQTEANAGGLLDSGVDFQLSAPVRLVKEFAFSEGGDALQTGVTALGNILEGYNTFVDKDTIQVDFLIAPHIVGSTDNITLVNSLVAIAQGQRKDCVVVTSPNKAAVVGVTSPVTSTIVTTDQYTNSSYLFVDNNYLKVYDKYNDEYIMIPASSSTAGIMAATDVNAAAWYSPGGPRRGQYLGVTGIAYSPNKSQRDTLYKAGVNPVANIPGQGLLLFGDKTKLARPSAFDRINVRRLFLVVERAIALAARNVMFEFNDEFTRAEFTGIIEPFLREVKGRRGITDFRVVCDETNNTASVIDRNEFIATILIKPARSINYVTLNFVAVRTGVDFAEVAGTV